MSVNILPMLSPFALDLCAEQGLKRKTCWKLLLSDLALIKCQGDDRLKFRFRAKAVLRFGRILTPPACLERSFLVTYLGVFSCLLYCKQIHHHIRWSLKKEIVDRAPFTFSIMECNPDLKGRGWKLKEKLFRSLWLSRQIHLISTFTLNYIICNTRHIIREFCFNGPFRFCEWVLFPISVSERPRPLLSPLSSAVSARRAAPCPAASLLLPPIWEVKTTSCTKWITEPDRSCSKESQVNRVYSCRRLDLQWWWW